MSSNVKRLLVEKREGFDLEAKALMKDLKDKKRGRSALLIKKTFLR